MRLFTCHLHTVAIQTTLPKSATLYIYTYIYYGIKFKFHGRIGFVKNQFWICNSNLSGEREKHMRTHHPRSWWRRWWPHNRFIRGVFGFPFRVSAPIELTPILFKVGLVFNFHHPQIIKVPAYIIYDYPFFLSPSKKSISKFQAHQTSNIADMRQVLGSQ